MHHLDLGQTWPNSNRPHIILLGLSIIILFYRVVLTWVQGVKGEGNFVLKIEKSLFKKTQQHHLQIQTKITMEVGGTAQELLWEWVGLARIIFGVVFWKIISCTSLIYTTKYIVCSSLFITCIWNMKHFIAAVEHFFCQFEMETASKHSIAFWVQKCIFLIEFLI